MKQLWGRCSFLALAQVCCLEGNGCRKWLYRNRFHSQGIKKATRGPAPSLPGSTTVGRPVLTAPTFLNPQLHTPIYYSPLKFIICGSLQLLCYSVQSLSHVGLFATPWIAVRQVSLSITNSRSSLKLMSIKLVMPSSHLILCRFSSCPQALPASAVYIHKSSILNLPSTPHTSLGRHRAPH